MKAIALILLIGLTIGSLCGGDLPGSGVYRSPSGIYTLTLSLLPNGNYLARWDADLGSNGSASGSWTLIDGEVRLVPKKEAGHPMTGYLRVLLMREFEGKKALIRKEDAKNSDNPFLYLYVQNPNLPPHPPGGAHVERRTK